MGMVVSKLLLDIQSNIIIDPNGCWNWKWAAVNGYGRVNNSDGRTGLVYKRLWEDAYGPVPQGKVLDHVCRNRLCCNLDHLRIATISENRLNSDYVNQNYNKQTCINGHEFTVENTYIHERTQERGCKECRREAVRRYRRRLCN
jgi:hypothetical protein